MSVPFLSNTPTTTMEQHTATNTVPTMNKMMHSSNEHRVTVTVPFSYHLLDPALRDSSQHSTSDELVDHDSAYNVSSNMHTDDNYASNQAPHHESSIDGDLNCEFDHNAILHGYVNDHYGFNERISSRIPFHQVLNPSPVQLATSPALDCIRSSSNIMQYSNFFDAQSASTSYNNVLTMSYIHENTGSEEAAPTNHPFTDLATEDGAAPRKNDLQHKTTSLEPVLSTHRVHKRKSARTTALRATCEGCRKLHIQCITNEGDDACEKCAKKGIDCIRLARAPYPKRARKAV